MNDKINYKKGMVIGLLVVAMAAVLAVITLIKDTVQTGIPAPDGNAPVPKAAEERFKLRKEYYDLLNDLDNMRYFSDFSAPDEIPEEELVLFGYMKAIDDETRPAEERQSVTLADINACLIKYFNRTIAGKTDTGYFDYDADTGEYIPTGWDMPGTQPHYLTDLSPQPDGSIAAVFDVYLFGESELARSPEEYLSDPASIPADIEHARAESAFCRREQQGTTYLQMISYKRLYDGVSNPNFPVDDSIRAVPFSPDQYLTDDEFVIAGGVRLGMRYEEVSEIIGNVDEAFENAPGVKSILKDGYHYGFYQIDDTFTNQSDLEKDGTFRLLHVSLNQFSHDEFPRGIKIGDSIEAVLTKFPGKDKELRKWARQNVYGRDEVGKPRAYLTFTMFDECYRLYATTKKQVLIVNFDRKNCVRSLEIVKEDS